MEPPCGLKVRRMGHFHSRVDASGKHHECAYVLNHKEDHVDGRGIDSLHIV